MVRSTFAISNFTPSSLRWEHTWAAIGYEWRQERIGVITQTTRSSRAACLISWSLGREPTSLSHLGASFTSHPSCLKFHLPLQPRPSQWSVLPASGKDSPSYKYLCCEVSKIFRSKTRILEKETHHSESFFEARQHTTPVVTTLKRGCTLSYKVLYYDTLHCTVSAHAIHLFSTIASAKTSVCAIVEHTGALHLVRETDPLSGMVQREFSTHASLYKYPNRVRSMTDKPTVLYLGTACGTPSST